MTECISCGRSLSDVARFCPVCGTPVVREPPASEAIVEASLPALAEAPTGDPVGAAPPTVAQPIEARPETVMEPAAGVAAQRGVDSVCGSTATVDAAVLCQACGAVVPAGDLFCGDCGAPVAGMAAAQPAAAAAAPRSVPSAFTQVPQPARLRGLPDSPPAGFSQPPHATGHPRPTGGGSAFADYLSFSALFIGENAVAVFWVAEGVNLLYWTFDWISHRYNAQQAFLWSVLGFILCAIVIRILAEVAVSVSRAREDVAAMREGAPATVDVGAPESSPRQWRHDRCRVCCATRCGRRVEKRLGCGECDRAEGSRVEGAMRRMPCQ